VTDLQELETPALVVDLDRMEANLDRAADYARRHGISLRPHIKTHKSPLLASEQLRRGAGGLTCATTFEAEVMSAVCDDILVMYPPVGEQRAERLARLAERVQLTVALDSETAARDLARATANAGTRARVLIEVDAGMHRVGVQSSADAVALARAVNEHQSLDVAGIAFYPGHVRGPVSEHGEHLAALTRLVTEVLTDFELADLPFTVVSAGSTPTLWQTHLVEGVTEMRPGTYVFNDRTTAEIGACEPAQCALTVLARVVSTAVPGQAVIDAGSKALGREPIRGSAGEGFGCLWNDPDVIVKSMSEEHGILDLSRSAWRPKVGDRVHIVPNHVCIVVHNADLVYGTRESAVVSSWPVAARGRGLPPVEDPSSPSLQLRGLGTSLGR
jgi:D-serine deaminase-like pyridoxal phosphate-dependent protein